MLVAIALSVCGLVYAARSQTAPVAKKPGVVQQPMAPPRAPTDCAKNADVDQDHARSRECGGTDCDDHDARRFPGNPEVCDPAGHDEDCDPSTFGIRDADGDGFPDSQCRNVDPITQRVTSQGTDCNDNAAYVHPGSQICVSDSSVSVCQGPGSVTLKCPPATPYCARQPNDVGVCVPAPH
jgi:hypothetical protein